MGYTYLIETICGGPDAAGGGCGAPLGVRIVTKEHFDSQPGRVYTSLQEHLDSEVGLDIGEDNSDYRIKLAFRSCSDCHQL